MAGRGNASDTCVLHHDGVANGFEIVDAGT